MANYKTENKTESSKKENAIASVKSKKERLENDITQAQQEINRWSETMEQEAGGRRIDGRTGKAGRGPAYRDAKRNMELHIENKKEAQKRYDNFMANEYDLEIKIAEENFAEQQIVQQFDLLSKFQALHQVIQEDKTGSTKSISWGIRILFILFEIIPSLIKLMTHSTEYDALLEARRRMNIQFAYARANEAMSEIKSDIDLIIEDLDKTPLPYMSEIETGIMS